MDRTDTRSYEQLQSEVEALRQQLDAAVAALEAVEWVEGKQGLFCPWCHRYKYAGSRLDFQGHAADCERKTKLAQARGQ